MVAKNRGERRIYSRGHKFRGPTPCSICYPGGRPNLEQGPKEVVTDQASPVPMDNALTVSQHAPV